jgi:tripartite-type tricarboxylate transporter receptor subunit TctC
MGKKTLVTLIGLGFGVSWAGWSAAQIDYPKRQIEFIIPFAPGGPADTAARIIQPQLSANLGVPIVLVNKPGGEARSGAISWPGQEPTAIQSTPRRTPR